MVEVVVRILIFFALASLAVWYCNKWFKHKQRVVVARTRKKWKRVCKIKPFDGRSIASQRLESRRLFKLGLIISIPISVFLAAYISNFAFKLPSSEPEQWGQMGDFFGGMLNPILAFASFIALLYTIRIQSEELRLTREEFAKSTEAQKVIAREAENQLSQQLLLEDYRHVSNQLRSTTATMKVLLTKEVTAVFPISSKPPSSIAELVSTLSQYFYAKQNNEQEDAESCFTRARHDYRSNCAPKHPVDAQCFYDDIAELLTPYLSIALELVRTIELHSAIGNHVRLEEVQRKIRLTDSNSAIYLVARAYILVRTFTQLSNQFSYEHFTFEDEELQRHFRSALVNLRLPSSAC